MQIFQGIKRNIFDLVGTAAFVLYILATQGWQTFGIIVIAVYNNRPWECLFIFIGFFIGREFFGKTYHAPTMWACTIFTWISFYILTSSVPTFSISITLPCIYGLCLSYVLALIGDYVSLKEGR